MIDKKRYSPFLLSFLIILVDQISKMLVVHFIPEGAIAKSFFGDWLWICHVRNDAIAFSMGSSLNVVVKYFAFIALPILLMGFVGYIIVARRMDNEFTTFQRWCLAGIFGGGIGNLIDRVFRHLRVVDWISTDMNGFLGMERFPTWNIADGSVVVSVILLLISFLYLSFKEKKGNEQKR